MALRTENVTAITSPDTALVADALVWTRQMAAKGFFQIDSARQRITALERLVSVLDDGEPQQVRWVLEHIETICDRWLLKTNATPNTASTYRSKSSRLLADYLSYLDNPSAFKPQQRGGGRERLEAPRRKPQAAPRLEARPVDPEPASIQAPPPAVGAPDLRTYPLGEGRGAFEYRLPKEGLTTRDVLRVAYHLLTMATDFDPTDPDRQPVIALKRRHDE
jgi:hypothetical protein